MRRLIVVGAGMASGRLLEHLTEAGGWDVTLFDAEGRGCYDRIRLSPMLAGEAAWSDIVTHDAGWYAARGVSCRFERVARIDRAARQVVSETGEALGYDALVLATGSVPFVPPIPGVDLDGVRVWRDYADTRAMMDLAPGARAAVIGGGVLGLEAAAGLAARGVAVTVVHRGAHLMDRQLDAVSGAMLAAELEARGIKVRCGADTVSVLGSGGRVRGLRLGCGAEVPCAMAIFAAGVRPNVGLAHAAGLTVERGVVVSDRMGTSDPNIHALGECVEYRGRTFGLVAPLYAQARVLADVLSGRPASFAAPKETVKLKVTGVEVFSTGDIADVPGRASIVMRDTGARVYRRLVIEEGRLMGAVLYGDASGSAEFAKLIETRAQIEEQRDTLILDPVVPEPVRPTIARAA